MSRVDQAKNITAREAAIKLMRAGEATHAEIARLTNVDRQLVAYWARQAGIDVTVARGKRLRERWAKTGGE